MSAKHDEHRHPLAEGQPQFDAHRRGYEPTEPMPLPPDWVPTEPMPLTAGWAPTVPAPLPRR